LRGAKPAALPAVLLAIEAAQWIWRAADWISRGDTLVRLASSLPTSMQLLTNPGVGLLLTIVGLTWLWWLTGERKPPVRLLNSQGIPIIPAKRMAVATVVVVTLITSVIAIPIWFAFRHHFRVQLVQVATLDQTTAVFMECNVATLPLSLPNGESVHVIPLNKKQMKTESWGFYEVYGGEQNKWPDKALLKRAKELHDPGVFCYKCRVSNHGVNNIVYLGVPIDLWFGDKSGDSNRVRFRPVISALDAGKTFEFYLINDCNISVSAVWQENARVQFAGEPMQKDIPLRRTYKSPIDQIMMFFPTTVRWANATACE